MRLFIEKIARYIIIGVGFGGITYPFFLWMNGAKSQTVTQLTTVMVTSALIGVVSMIFEVDRLSFPVQLGTHMVLVYGLVSGMSILNGISSPLSFPFVGSVFFVYGVTWWLVEATFRGRIKRINDKLAEKQK